MVLLLQHLNEYIDSDVMGVSDLRVLSMLRMLN